MHLVLHLHRLDDADDLACLDLIPLRDLDREDGALHRTDHGVLAGGAAATGALALTAPTRELRERRFRPEHAHLETLCVDLHKTNCWGQNPFRGLTPYGG